MQFELSETDALLEGFDLQRIVGPISLETCAMACLLEGHDCLSFEHNAASGQCNLNFRVASSLAQVTFAAGWAYYERTTFDDGALLQQGAHIIFGFNSLLSRTNTVNITFVANSPDGLLWRQVTRKRKKEKKYNKLPPTKSKKKNQITKRRG